MKRIFSILLLLTFIHMGYSQGGTFTVSVNNKAILLSKIMPTAMAEKATISKTSIKESNIIIIDVKEKEPQKDWHRVFILYNAKDEEIGRYTQKTTSGKFSITVKAPEKKAGSVVKISTMNEPNDPNAAATMRLRTFPLVDITVK